MKKRFNLKTQAIFSSVLLSSILVLGGCSGDSEESATAPAPAKEQNTMAVKEPTPVPTPKPMVDEQVKEAVKQVEQKAAEVEKQVVEKVEEMKKEVAAVTAPTSAKVDGQSAYATCAGCHGGNGEGGVGPVLNNQTVEEIVTKLEKYKAGEQMGPMTGMMAPMASGLSTETMQAIAEYITAK